MTIENLEAGLILLAADDISSGSALIETSDSKHNQELGRACFEYGEERSE